MLCFYQVLSLALSIPFLELSLMDETQVCNSSIHHKEKNCSLFEWCDWDLG